MPLPVRDRSLITGGGGATTLEGGGGESSQVLPLQRGEGGRISSSHGKRGGGHKRFEVVLTQDT